MTEPLVVRRETHMAASPATVLAFLTDPEEILSWVGTQAHPGGLYLVKGASATAPMWRAERSGGRADTAHDP
jgi:uncharacterized protein YndB with AHSA1/START domain